MSARECYCLGLLFSAELVEAKRKSGQRAATRQRKSPMSYIPRIVLSLPDDGGCNLTETGNGNGDRNGYILLRGTIVNRTYGIHKKTYIFDQFYKQYLVLLTMVPRNSGNGRVDGNGNSNSNGNRNANANGDGERRTETGTGTATLTRTERELLQ